jgi:hypothetical protein
MSLEKRAYSPVIPVESECVLNRSLSRERIYRGNKASASGLDPEGEVDT